MKRLICLLLALIILITTLSACAAEPEPTEISWTIIEEIERDGDEVHYRIHLSNGMAVDRYTREVEE